MAWHGAWRAGSDRVYANASELFRVLSPLPEKTSVAGVCGVDACDVYHHRARNRASQSRSAWGDGRVTWPFSAHRTGRLFRLDVRFCHESSFAGIEIGGQPMEEPTVMVKFWRVQHLNNLELMHVTCLNQVFSRHLHETFAIGVVEGGIGAFTYRGATQVAPVGSIFVINPGEAHTGGGFE